VSKKESLLETIPERFFADIVEALIESLKAGISNSAFPVPADNIFDAIKNELRLHLRGLDPGASIELKA